MRLTWPLTGRSQEMRIIQDAISDRGSAGIVVHGAAGVGKSRIASEALSSVASQGYETRWAVGTSSARELPLGVFAQWVGSAGPHTLLVVRDVLKSLTNVSPGAKAVVGVDDVHLLDDLSIFVLHQIAARRAAHLVLTVRDGEPVPAATQELLNSGQFERLDLQPLSREEMATLVSASLRGSVDPDALRRLWQMTRGNVLYLRNIVDQEVAAGRLERLGGFWRWTEDPIVPPGLVEMIEVRIGDLAASTRDVVDVLAVGEPLELSSLRRITDPAAVDDAEARGLIVIEKVDDTAEVRVAHPLYGEVRRRGAALLRLRRLRALVANELAAGDRADDMRVVVRRAALSLDSDLVPDPDLLLRASQGAVMLADLPLAHRLAAAAVRAGGGTEADLVVAHALSWLGRGQESDAVLAHMTIEDGADTTRARVAFLRAVNMMWPLADPDGAKEFIDGAALGTPPHAKGFIDAFRTVYWATMGRPDAAIASSKDLVLDGFPAVVGGVTAWGIALAAGDCGRTGEALAAATAGAAITTRSFDAAQMGYIIAGGHVGALLLAGRIAEATEVADRLRTNAADLPGAASLLSAAIAGRAAVNAGRLEAGCTLLGPVVELMFSIGDTNGFGYQYHLPYTTALAMRGCDTEAGAALEQLEKWRYPSTRQLDYAYGIARSWVAASKGAISEAIRIVLAAAEVAGANGQFAAEVMCLQTAAQFGDGAAAPRLHALAAVVEGPRAGIAVRFAEAVRNGDGAVLSAVSDDFENIGDFVAAIDAAGHAAVAYRRRDQRGSALACSKRAAELAERCGARTPALRLATEELPLTDREREIVMMLGNGLSSRAVADRLRLSVRTVEGHIYRAMSRTGTTSRDELAALLRRPGSPLAPGESG